MLLVQGGLEVNPDHTVKESAHVLADRPNWNRMTDYADLRKQPRIDLAREIPLNAPLTVYVEPTNRCNLACDFCPQSLLDYKERAGYWEHMPLYLFERLMREIKEMGVKSLKLYFFGEPLMHPQIGSLCAEAAGNCERVELTTNLIPLTEMKAAAIMTSGIHYVRVSWYGEKPERVIANLKMLKAHRVAPLPHIAVKFLRREDVVDGLECDEVCVEQLHTIGSDFVHLRSYEENKKACPYPFYTLVVKSNGDVVPCCVAWDKSLVVGNVSSNTLAELWRSPKMKAIRLAHLRGERSSLAACAQCDVLFNCPDSVDSVSAEEYKKRVDEPECWRKPWMSYSDNHEG